jgi:hypothetical protein
MIRAAAVARSAHYEAGGEARPARGQGWTGIRRSTDPAARS